MTQPSSEVEARPRRSASSNAATTRSACAISCADGEKHSLSAADLLGMNREPALEADALGAQRVVAQAVGIAQLEVRRVERQHVRRAGCDAQRLARVRDLRLVLEALDAHVVREVLAAERHGHDALARAADRADVDDGFGGLDPRDESQGADARGRRAARARRRAARWRRCRRRRAPCRRRRRAMCGPTTAARSSSIHSVSSAFTRGITGMPEAASRGRKLSDRRARVGLLRGRHRVLHVGNEGIGRQAERFLEHVRLVAGHEQQAAKDHGRSRLMSHRHGRHRTKVVTAARFPILADSLGGDVPEISTAAYALLYQLVEQHYPVFVAARRSSWPSAGGGLVVLGRPTNSRRQ